ncbi:MAG: xanthine dehydrogenase family protein molybdopterin-binding subunit [Betaproteobacteria bacterium]|nr:MAG: xanthine dehydrogenase family protein molybdopterin-binding subunit [Betaproteobacteria bacterium]
MKRYVGRSIPRVEDRRFLTGTGRYTDDINLQGQLHCAFLRSPHAHARILRVDSGRARRAPGVCAVLTGADYFADGLAGIEHAANPVDALDVRARAFVAARGARIVELPHWPLARERARHVGEPLAAVVAGTALAARDAAELIEIEYEPLPAVASAADALREGAAQLWDEAPGNLCVSAEFGDAGAARDALARAAHVVRREFVNNRVANCQMEPRSAIGDYDRSTGTCTLVSGNQGVVRLRATLAAALKLPAERVRVVSPDVGGAFGLRNNLYPEQVVVAWAAKRIGRPVKWTGERSEAFVSDYQGRDSVLRAALALDAGGRILGYEVDLVANVGAHAVSFVPAANGMRILSTVYHVPAAHIVVRGVLTNTAPTAPFRGAGRPEVTHAIERLLDVAARPVGIDRIEIRRRNLVRRETLPYRNAMGLVYDSGDFAGYMDRALALADWAGFPGRRAAARARGRLAGIGVANHIEAPVGAPAERAALSVRSDGTVEAIVGTQSSGQGHETTFAQVIADRLGVAIEVVRIRYGDSGFAGQGGGTHSDRSMRLAGTLFVRAAAEIVERGRAAAVALLEAAAADLAFEAGRYRIAGTDRAVSLFELARAIESGKLPAEMREALAATQDFSGRIPAFPAGTAVCEVEVDPETGTVRIVRYTAVDDVGQAVNPMIVEGQTHGGIAQGVGQALREGVALDPASGQAVTGTFMDYAICRADDLPSFQVGHAEDRTEGNPLHVKGAGEGGVVPATAAVVNALCDALRVEDVPMPATSEAVSDALSRRR